MLMPGASAEKLATVETLLGKDEEYTKAGAAFLTAPAREPAYDRMDSRRFFRHLRSGRILVLPKATSTKGRAGF